MASSVPQKPGILDGAPARIGPSVERTERLIEGTAEIRELVQSRGLDPPGIEVATDQPVPFRAPQRVGEDLVGDPVQGVMDVAVAPTAYPELSENWQRPTSRNEMDHVLRRHPPENVAASDFAHVKCSPAVCLRQMGRYEDATEQPSNGRRPEREPIGVVRLWRPTLLSHASREMDTLPPQPSSGRRCGKYPEESRRDVADLRPDQHRTIADVSKELDLVEQLVGDWVRQEKLDRDEREGLTREERDKLDKLCRDVKRFPTECELLKTLPTFIARGHSS